MADAKWRAEVEDRVDAVEKIVIDLSSDVEDGKKWLKEIGQTLTSIRIRLGWIMGGAAAATVMSGIVFTFASAVFWWHLESPWHPKAGEKLAAIEAVQGTGNKSDGDIRPASD